MGRGTAGKALDVAMLAGINALWGAQYAAYKALGDRIDPAGLTALIFLVAAPLVGIFYLRERRRAAPSPRPPGRSLASPRNLLGFFATGVAGLVPTSVFMAWGVERSTASNGALLGLTIPVLTALLAAAFLGERMGWRRWAGLGVALAGVLVLSLNPAPGSGMGDVFIDVRQLDLAGNRCLLGNLLVMASCLGSCLYNVGSKDLLRRFTPLEVLAGSYAIAFALSLPLLAFGSTVTPASLARLPLQAWAALGVLATLVWGLSMVAWLYVLERIDVSQASVSIYLLPFFGVLIAAAVLGERVTGIMIAGGLVTLAGTAFVVWAEKRQEAEAVETGK